MTAANQCKYFDGLRNPHVTVMYILESRGTLVMPAEKVATLIEHSGKEGDIFQAVMNNTIESEENLCLAGKPHIKFEISGNRIEAVVTASSEFSRDAIRRMIDIAYTVLRDLAFSILDENSMDESKTYVVLKDIALTRFEMEQ